MIELLRSEESFLKLDYYVNFINLRLSLGLKNKALNKILESFAMPFFNKMPFLCASK